MSNCCGYFFRVERELGNELFGAPRARHGPKELVFV